MRLDEVQSPFLRVEERFRAGCEMARELGWLVTIDKGNREGERIISLRKNCAAR